LHTFNTALCQNCIGESLEVEDIISNHSVEARIECSLKCLKEQSCAGYNYRSRSKIDDINCQISANTTLERSNILYGPWVFYQDLETLPVSI
jgi:hypothetical protein